MSSLRRTAPISADESAAPELASSVQTAEYIADMTQQLERLARGAELARLADLLAKAREEVWRSAFG